MILKVISANSVDPDQTAPLLFASMQKIGLKSLQEYSAEDIFRCRLRGRIIEELIFHFYVEE